jgi:ribosomal protein L34E
MDAAILPRLTSLSLWFDARQRASVRDRFQDSRRRCRSQCIGWLRTPSASFKLHWQSRGQPSSATCEGLFCGRCLSGMQRLRSECHYRMCLTGRAETADNSCPHNANANLCAPPNKWVFVVQILYFTRAQPTQRFVRLGLRHVSPAVVTRHPQTQQ